MGALAEPADSGAAADPTPAKPLWRGVLHQYGTFVALGAGAVLTTVAPSARSAWASVAFTGSLVLLFGVSAIYHRLHWSPKARAWMRRADHASIFVLIAGTYTPVTLLGLADPAGSQLLAVVWLGALLGVLQTLFWIKAPKVVTAGLAIAVGWSMVPYWGEVRSGLSAFQLQWIILGGVFYTLGALCYAAKRPNPWPGIFGYHEFFHLGTIIAAVMHFIAVASIVLAH